MQKDVCVNIKSVQSSEGESDTTELFTNARFAKLRGKNEYRITYDESETTGFSGSRVSLEFSEDMVKMMRSGNAVSTLIIEKGKRHYCHYGTPYGDFMVGISTDEIRSNVTDNGGDLYLKYSVDINTGLVSENEMYISIKEISPKEGFAEKC